MYKTLLVVFTLMAYTKARDELCNDPNASFYECGSPCNELCEFFDGGCGGVCVPRCQCNPGFVLNNSKCIRREDCPCDEPNMEFTACGTKCPATCLDAERYCSPCWVGCQCKKGFVWNNLRCVKPEECPIM